MQKNRQQNRKFRKTERIESEEEKNLKFTL